MTCQLAVSETFEVLKDGKPLDQLSKEEADMLQQMLESSEMHNVFDEMMHEGGWRKVRGYLTEEIDRQKTLVEVPRGSRTKEIRR